MLEIRQMLERDIPEAVCLFLDAFSRAPWEDDWSAKEAEDFLKAFHSMAVFRGFLAFWDGVPAALCIGMIKPWRKGMEYYIDQFCVAPRFQGKGVGSAFLRETERLLAAEGVRGAVLHTERSFPAYHFYRKNGFRKAEGLAVMYRE